jgi:hypothetical protein
MVPPFRGDRMGFYNDDRLKIKKPPAGHNRILAVMFFLRSPAFFPPPTTAVKHIMK